MVQTDTTDTVTLARVMRRNIVSLCHRKNASHLGGALSVIDILTVLYGKFLRITPDNPDNSLRDRLFYSKGHACTALYCILEYLGFFTDLSNKFTSDGSVFTSHVNHKVPGVELSTGSLGHALPVAAGVAFAGKLQKRKWKVCCIISDGELEEGSNWESLLFAPSKGLTNLCCIIDYNKLQAFGYVSDILDLAPLDKKLESFGWETVNVDGHNHVELVEVFNLFFANQNKNPLAIIANTIKGKGVSFMEDKLLWHYRSPRAEDLQKALKELE